MSEWISTFPLTQHCLGFAKKQICKVVRTGPVPEHIGFIMDGNRRYAKQKHIQMEEGHNAGFESMAKLLEVCYDCGVKSVSVFAFSIENFSRSNREIDWLMKLFKKRFKQVIEHGDLCDQYGIKIKVVGNVKMLPKDVRQVLEEAEELTKNNTRAILNVCAPYTSRDDITHSIRTIVKEGLNSKDITEETIGEHLYTGDVSKLELLIRTSDVHRLSDFMLWEAVDIDCDIEIINILWPEFSPLRLLWVLFKWGFNRTYYGNRTAKLLNLNEDGGTIDDQQQLKNE